MNENTMWRLARTPPAGWPSAEDFRLDTGPVPEPADGQLVSETIYLSLDPYQWYRRRNGTEAPGDVCHGRTVSRVIRTRHPDYREGDYLFNTNGWQLLGLTGTGISNFNYMYPRPIDPSRAPISTAIGVLGMLGLTAYAGMIVQCAPRSGETVVVSAASGGVGQVAGQLARINGCRVVGVAGTAEKCEFVTGFLGFDACISRLDSDFEAQLAAACPDGIDVYFENVGGAVYEAVLPRLNPHARITQCGMISQYGSTADETPQEAWQRVGQPYFDRQNVTVHPLFVGNYVDSHQAEFLDRMADWVASGAVRYKEDLWQGLESAPEAFMAMLKGGNFGKTIVGVGEDPTLTEDLKARRDGPSII